MSDENWKTLYEVRAVQVRHEDGDLGSTIEIHYEIVNLHNGSIEGRYEDRKYACKQARYKYRKLVRTMEQCFMS